MKKVFLVFLVMIIGSMPYSTIVLAGGGDDHTHANEAATPTVKIAGNGQLRVVSYPGSLEVFVKYPAPKLQEPVTSRLFFTDYATNHPVDPTSIELSFPGALGAKVTKQPTKVSDGVYEFVAIFARDTGHTGLLKYTYGDAKQLASLSPFYAGTSATRVIAATGGSAVEDEGSMFSTWLLVPIAIALILLGYVLFRRRRNRLNIVTSKPASTTSATTSAATSVKQTSSTT